MKKKRKETRKGRDGKEQIEEKRKKNRERKRIHLFPTAVVYYQLTFLSSITLGPMADDSTA